MHAGARDWSSAATHISKFAQESRQHWLTWGILRIQACRIQQNMKHIHHMKRHKHDYFTRIMVRITSSHTNLKDLHWNKHVLWRSGNQHHKKCVKIPIVSQCWRLSWANLLILLGGIWPISHTCITTEHVGCKNKELPRLRLLVTANTQRLPCNAANIRHGRSDVRYNKKS